MSWKAILKGHEEENHPHIQTFREKGTKDSQRLKVIGEKKRKEGTKGLRVYPIKERGLRTVNMNPVETSVAYSIWKKIGDIAQQADNLKDNPKLKDMAEGSLTLDQIFQQSNFEYPDDFEYKHNFMEEKEGERDRWSGELTPIKIPEDILAKVSNKTTTRLLLSGMRIGMNHLVSMT